MKRIIFLILLASLFANLFAQQEVTINEIKIVSVHYMSVYSPDRMLYSASDIVSVSYITRQKKPAIYEVLFQNGNTILLSGSKACIPVLGCNFSGKGETIVDNNDIPCCLHDMLEGMLMDIEFALSNDTITLYHQAEWEELLSVDFLNKENTREQKGPLLTSIWGQNISNHGGDINAYNHYVEKKCGDRNCSAGCVAVAMAQVLYYWKHPWQTNMDTHYDWCNMQDSLFTDNNPRYDTTRNAVAKLIFDCAESVKMAYCDNGCSSGAKVKDARNALVHTFQYSIDADYRRRFWWSDSDWKGFIKKDINNGRPIIYRGQGSGGHAFVCDGYNDDDKFHFNWGWNGSHNGWFTLSSITPGSDNYSNRQRAIFEIHPNSYHFVNYCNAQVNLPAIYAICQANGVYDFWNVVPWTGRRLESCDERYPAEWRTIPTGESSRYIAFEEVVLHPGFTAEEGSNFIAEIRECPNCSGTIMLNGGGNQMVEQEEQEDFIEPEFLTDIFEHCCADGISVYPNPTTGDIIVKMAYIAEQGEIRIINGLGIVIRAEKIKDAITRINLSELNSGVYYLVITTEGKTVSRKIVKQ